MDEIKIVIRVPVKVIYLLLFVFIIMAKADLHIFEDMIWGIGKTLILLEKEEICDSFRVRNRVECQPISGINDNRLLRLIKKDRTNTDVTCVYSAG